MTSKKIDMKHFEGDLTLYFFLISLGVLFLLGVGYQIVFWKKGVFFGRYSLHYQIKKIVIIALFSATSTSILFVCWQFLPLTVLPAARVAFEGVLVKIAGFLFGPFVGIISAITTELAVLIFMPTYFHYKYLLVLISFGFFAGLVKTIINWKRMIKWELFLAYLGLIIFFVISQLFFYLSLSRNNALSLTNFESLITAFKNKYLVHFNFETGVFYGNLACFLLLFILITIMAVVVPSKRYKLKFISKKTLRKVLPIFIFALFSEYLISVFIATNANQSVFGESTRGGFILFTSSILLAPFKIIINTIIIYNVWNACQFYISRKLIS